MFSFIGFALMKTHDVPAVSFLWFDSTLGAAALLLDLIVVLELTVLYLIEFVVLAVMLSVYNMLFKITITQYFFLSMMHSQSLLIHSQEEAGHLSLSKPSAEHSILI